MFAFPFLVAALHSSWMFSRLRTPPSGPISIYSILNSMIDRGMMFFFLSQGVGILLEKAALDSLSPAWRKQRFLISAARRVWMFTVLILPGTVFLDSLLQQRLMTKDILDGFGLKALGLMMQGKKY